MIKFGVKTELPALQGKGDPVKLSQCPHCGSPLVQDAPADLDPLTPTCVNTYACPNCGTAPFET